MAVNPPPLRIPEKLLADPAIRSFFKELIEHLSSSFLEEPPSSANWGSIGGLLSNQIDLQTALDAKAALSHFHDAGDITTGVFPDASISESSVTQHEGAIDHDALLNFLAAEHFTVDSIYPVVTNITTVTTTSHTAGNEHRINVDDDTAGSQVTVALPSASGISTIYEIKKQGTTANVVIDGDGVDTIDGDLTATLTGQDENLTIAADGISNWDIL